MISTRQQLQGQIANYSGVFEINCPPISHLCSTLNDVNRRKSIFDFATKELTATAFWAWVLHGEQSDDAALRMAASALRSKLGVPADASFESIELESNPDDPGLKPLMPLDSDSDKGRRRIDILVTYRVEDGSLVRYVIENKVRRDANAINQVIDYRDRLQKRVTGPVRAAVFTFDDSLKRSMPAKDSGVVVVTLSDMVKLIEECAQPGTVLDDYCNFLKDKLTVASASPVQGPNDQFAENLARWSVVATQLGIQNPLDEYVRAAGQYGFSANYSKGKSVFLTLHDQRPVVSVHPEKSSRVSGLWFGVSVTNLMRAHDFHITSSDMPATFAWQFLNQSNNEWRFGYIALDQIAPTLRMISRAASRH